MSSMKGGNGRTIIARIMMTRSGAARRCQYKPGPTAATAIS
jgi:hypothetical protein